MRTSQILSLKLLLSLFQVQQEDKSKTDVYVHVNGKLVVQEKTLHQVQSKRALQASFQNQAHSTTTQHYRDFKQHDKVMTTQRRENDAQWSMILFECSIKFNIDCHLSSWPRRAV